MKLLCMILVAFPLLSIAGCAKTAVRAEQRVASSLPHMNDSLTKAAQLLNNGLKDQSEQMINEELKREPNNVDAYVMMGLLELSKENFSKASDPYFEAAVKLDHSRINELFPLLASFYDGEDCSARGVQFHLKGQPHGDTYEPAPLVDWISRTDKKAAMQDERIAATLVLAKQATPEEFMTAFPESRRTPHLLHLIARDSSELYPQIARKYAKLGFNKSPQSEDGKACARLLEELDLREKSAKGAAQRAEELQIVGAWESIDTAITITIEFLEDGTAIERMGALQQSEHYTMNGHEITVTGRNFIDGKREPSQTSTWEVVGNMLTLHGAFGHGRYRRLR